MADEGRSEFLGILERDYRVAQELMESSSGSVDRTRTFGFTLVAALIGFTFTDHVRWLGLLAAAATFIVAYVDSYHCWGYDMAFKHALRIERIDQLRYKAHLTMLNSRDMNSLEVRVGSFRPGVLSGRGRFKIRREIWFSLPRPLLILYPLLALAGVGAGVDAQNSAHAERPINVHVTSGEMKVHDPGTLVLAALTREEREQLAKLAAQLRRSDSVQERELAVQIAQLLAGVPGTIDAIESLFKGSGDNAEKALEIIVRVLSRVATSNLTYAPSTTVSGTRFSLGGFNLTVNADGRPKPSSPCNGSRHCAARCQRCSARKPRSEWHRTLPLTP
jgi:hypothetical protein